MQAEFPAIIEPVPEGGYWAICPEILLALLPSMVGGITQCTSLIVSDPDKIYRTALAAGAEIVDDIADFEFGGRTFSCRDIESHVWVFTSHDPWNKFW